MEFEPVSHKGNGSQSRELNMGPSNEVANIPRYGDVLQFTGLSSEQYSELDHTKYAETIRFRLDLIREQERIAEKQIIELRAVEKRGGDAFAQSLENAFLLLTAISARINDMEFQDDLFPAGDDFFLIEENLDVVSTKLRDLKSIIANLYSIGGFQSVGENVSKTPEIGPGQLADTDLYSQYARYDLAPEKYESYFNKIIGVENIHSESVLLSSGMACVTTVLALCKRKDTRAGGLLFGNSLYFENKNSAQQTASELGEEAVNTFQEGDQADLVNKMELDPGVIFFEPVANSRDLSKVDFEKILSAPTKHTPRVVIIDTTIFGLNFNFQSVADQIDGNTVVLLINSLQKSFQEGDGISSAGIVTVMASSDTVAKDFSAKLKAFRGMLGTNIQPYNLKLLQETDVADVKEYSKLIGENVVTLASGLQSNRFENVDKIVTGDIDKGISGPLVFYVQFKVPLGQEFVNKAIAVASTRNIQLTDGASFGFKTTRLMVIGGDQYSVRICPGVENPRQIKVLEQIFTQALHELEAEVEAKAENEWDTNAWFKG